MFKARLFVFGNEYPILDFDTNIKKKDDGTGLPITRSNGGKLNISIPSPKDISELFEAAVAARKMIKGYIRIYKRDGFQKHTDYEFANAYVLKFQETFNATDNNPVICKLILSAGILRINGFIYENEWNPNNPFNNDKIKENSNNKEELKKIKTKPKLD